MDKTTKLAIPATIIIASLILGGFYYASQVNKQKSIERQQELKLQEDRRADETKAEKEHKEYVAKRKLECYAIYEKEREQYSNTSNFGYVEHYNWDKTPDYRDDTCEIIYENKDTGKAIKHYY